MSQPSQGTGRGGGEGKGSEFLNKHESLGWKEGGGGSNLSQGGGKKTLRDRGPGKVRGGKSGGGRGGDQVSKNRDVSHHTEARNRGKKGSL